MCNFAGMSYQESVHEAVAETPIMAIHITKRESRENSMCLEDITVNLKTQWRRKCRIRNLFSFWKLLCDQNPCPARNSMAGPRHQSLLIFATQVSMCLCVCVCTRAHMSAAGLGRVQYTQGWWPGHKEKGERPGNGSTRQCHDETIQQWWSPQLDLMCPGLELTHLISFVKSKCSPVCTKLHHTNAKRVRNRNSHWLYHFYVYKQEHRGKNTEA